MEKNRQHPMEALLLFTAKTLRHQYAGRPEERDFARLIDAAQEVSDEPQAEQQRTAAELTQIEAGQETADAAKVAEHEQGKLPPTVPTP